MLVKLLTETARTPTRGTPGSAGLDLYSDEDVHLLFDGPVVKVSTGIAVGIPTGFVGLIRDRSSYGSKGIITTAGVIDSDYRGEVLVCMANLTVTDYKINKGDKIAQMLILPTYMCNVDIVDELLDTQRTGGFGSTD